MEGDDFYGDIRPTFAFTTIKRGQKKDAVLRVPDPVQRRIFPLQLECFGMNWNKTGYRGVRKFENMVARDGLEPPTPAFSGLRSTN